MGKKDKLIEAVGFGKAFCECWEAVCAESLGGGAPMSKWTGDPDLDVLTTHGIIKTRTPHSAAAVRALDRERQKWQDAALSGGLPERLPRTIDANVLRGWHREHEQRRWDVIALLEGARDENTGPDYGGKYAAVSMIGWLADFNGALSPTVIDVITFHGVDWYVLTDSTETWVEVDPGFHVKGHEAFLQAVVSPGTVNHPGQSVEQHGSRPFMGTWKRNETKERKTLSDHALLGEIVTPLMPVNLESWKEERVKSGLVSDALAGQLEADHFVLEPEDFIHLVAEHQKACHRFAHALWAVNWCKIEGKKEKR